MRTKEAIEHCNRFMRKDARCLYTDGGAAFGSVEEHFKCRNAVMKTYPQGHFPIFEGYNHMQYQIRDPQEFAGMLAAIMEQSDMPILPFVRK